MIEKGYFEFADTYVSTIFVDKELWINRKVPWLDKKPNNSMPSSVYPPHSWGFLFVDLLIDFTAVIRGIKL